MKKINIEFTKSQFLQLMKLGFLGEFVINGHSIEEFNKEAESLKDFLIEEARKNKIEDYISYYKGSKCYDYSPKYSSEFFGILEEYVDEDFGERIVETISKNELHKKYSEIELANMSDDERYMALEKIIDDVDNQLMHKGYSQLYLSSDNPLFQK